jgi:hypothetical protein
MYIFYIGALLPLLIGAFLLWKDNEVVWWEWLISAGASFLLAGILHASAIYGMTGDVETWSGQIVKASHHPRWVERWTKHHSETYYTGSGKDRKSHTRHWTTTEYDTHPEHWEVTRNFGSYDDERDVDESFYNEVSRKFGGKIVEDGTQSSHHGGTRSSGDRNIYSTHNHTGYVFPVTTSRSFENRVKAAPTVFSFAKVPTNINIYPWPQNNNWNQSDRLCGTAAVLINLYKWDCMNSYLGPRKQVNVIMVGFGNEPTDYGQWQQAKWIGGKKNDLVLCFGGATKNKPATWSYVFGWTESELVKKNLQTLLIDKPINDALIPLIIAEIEKNYVIKDWHKFDYITIDPPTWSYWVFFIFLILTQSGLYYFFHVNEYGKDWAGYGRGWYANRRY